MTRQRQILVTVTYNDLGCIIDTKTELYKEPNLQPTCNNLATDTISRQDAIDAVEFGITYAKVLNKETGEVMELFKESNEELQKLLTALKHCHPQSQSGRRGGG